MSDLVGTQIVGFLTHRLMTYLNGTVEYTIADGSKSVSLSSSYGKDFERGIGGCVVRVIKELL